MKTITAFFAALLLMISSAALALDAPSFDEVDTNGDGYVSNSELQAAGLDIRVEDHDTNGDGVLDRQEYEAAIASISDD